MTSLFVTSSGTDIGKTHFCCRLLAELPSGIRVRCIKPVVTGFDSENLDSTDTARLLRAQHRPIDREAIDATSPWRFMAPLSVDMAAARENIAVAFDELVAFSKPTADADLNLIEGVGGVMAPIDAEHTVLDWIAALETSVVLVVGSYLGSLSHSLTAVNALRQRHRPPLAIVISQSLTEPVATEETAASLARHLGDVPITVLPRDEAAAAASRTAEIQRLLNLA